MRTLLVLVAAGVACQVAVEGDGLPSADTGLASVEDSAGTVSDGGAGHPGPAPVSDSFLARYDFDERAHRFDLPGRLDEISGLAMTPDGRLFAHDDERGRVHEIDRTTGEVGKRFDLGAETVRDDFEGIAVVGERFFLVSSTGLLYEFREGEDRAHVQYRITDAEVGPCEVEGLDYDPELDALLLACKVFLTDPSSIVVQILPIDPARERPSPVRAPKRALVDFGLPPEFDPSAILATPWGTWLLASARQEALMEMDRSGRVLAAVPLRKGRHPQSEGLEVDDASMLYIADEKNGQDPRVSVYAPVREESHP